MSAESFTKETSSPASQSGPVRHARTQAKPVDGTLESFSLGLLYNVSKLQDRARKSSASLGALVREFLPSGVLPDPGRTLQGEVQVLPSGPETGKAPSVIREDAMCVYLKRV